jgi:hypothetical protein
MGEPQKLSDKLRSMTNLNKLGQKTVRDAAQQLEYFEEVVLAAGPALKALYYEDRYAASRSGEGEFYSPPTVKLAEALNGITDDPEAIHICCVINDWADQKEKAS